MSFSLKNKSIWKHSTEKTTKYIQFRIFIAGMDITLHESTPINHVYIVTMKRHRKTFTTTAMPAIKYTDNRYYVVFDQTFLLPANMIFLNETVRAKYAVVTVKHKDRNNADFIFDAEVFLPLHEFFLDANKNLMMPKDPSYTFTVGKNEIRLNLHVDMKEIESEPFSRSFRSLGNVTSLRELSDSGRSRSNSISSDSSYLSNSSFTSFPSASANHTPAPSPGKSSRDLNRSVSNRSINDSALSVNQGKRIPRNDPKLKQLMNSFPSIDSESSISADAKENAMPVHENVNVQVEEEDTGMKKQKEKIEEMVRLYMLKKESLRLSKRQTIVHTVSVDEKEPVMTEETTETIESSMVKKALLSGRKTMSILLMASVCLLMFLSPKTNPLLGSYLSYSYRRQTEIPLTPLPVLEESLPQQSRRSHPERQSGLIDADEGRHIPRFLRAIRRFLERINPLRIFANVVRRFRGKGLVPASNEVEKRAFA